MKSLKIFIFISAENLQYFYRLLQPIKKKQEKKKLEETFFEKKRNKKAGFASKEPMIKDY